MIKMGKRIVLGDRKSLARMAYKGTLEANVNEVGRAGADVLTVLRLLTDSDPGAVVLLYANSSIHSEEECLKAGAKGYFEYPARPDEMLAAVKKLIG